MIAEKMKSMVANSSAIRAMFEEGNRLAGIYGAENVYDFSLGNPNVPAPEAVNQAIKDILDTEDSLLVHGYMSNTGYEDVRQMIAESLNKRFQTNFQAQNLIMTVGAMLIYWITLLASGGKFGISLTMSTYYINMASFLAFATLFPDVQVYFMMILPVKIKWLAIVDGVYLGYTCLYYVSAYFQRAGNLSGLVKLQFANVCFSEAAAIVLSVLNFLIFFLATRNIKKYSPRVTLRMLWDFAGRKMKRIIGTTTDGKVSSMDPAIMKELDEFGD